MVERGGGARQCRRWIGSVGTMATPRLTLTDGETGTVLTTWPETA
ncbi:hypothetical protein [Streptomyces sp. IBSBF 3136]